VKRITTKTELVELAEELGVRSDWHEPDEREVTATTHGRTFGNAGFWGETHRSSDGRDFTERYVKLHKNGKAVAVVNLATLFAWATGLEDR
jgi:hypothetical protein